MHIWMEVMIYWPPKYKPTECCLKTALILLFFLMDLGERGAGTDKNGYKT